MEKHMTIHESQNNINCIIYTDGKTTVSRAVIFCHGFGGHKGNGAAKRFANYVLSKYKGLAVICFDWPCHGDDVKKKLCLADCDDYLDDVIRFAREELGAQELYLYATSFGGYLSLRYLSLHGNPFTKIALRCPAVNMYEVLTTAIMTDENRKLLERGKEAQVGFDRKILISNAFLNELKAEDIMGKDFLAYADDILILHGTKDEIVPISAVTAFSENNVVEMIPIENADHRFIDAGKMTEAIQHIERFFAF